MADSDGVDAAAARTVPYRRIGTILVDRRLISAEQLAGALDEQERTGRPLGEICVERFGLDRLSLADALAEQWEEMQQASAAAGEGSAPAAPEHPASDGETATGPSPEDELRILLEEAEAARVELAAKTDELGRRLAALETLVVGVSDALAELRPDDPDGNGRESNGAGRGATTAAGPRRSRSRTRAATPRATSA